MKRLEPGGPSRCPLICDGDAHCGVPALLLLLLLPRTAINSGGVKRGQEKGDTHHCTAEVHSRPIALYSATKAPAVVPLAIAADSALPHLQDKLV